MAAPLFTSPVLSGLARSISLYSIAPIVPGYVPIPIFTVIHAVRSFIGYQHAIRAKGAQDIPFAQGLFGFLVTAWGGTTLSSMLLGLPPVWIWNTSFFFTYVVVYNVLSSFEPIIDLLLRTPPELLALLDGLYRTSGAIGTLHLSLSHTSAALRTSPLAAIVLGALTTGGGGLIVSTFGLAEPEWTLHTPPVLRGDMWSTLDLWGGGVAVLVYALLTNVHEGLALPKNAMLGTTMHKGRAQPVYSESEAKALAIVVGMSLFLARTWRGKFAVTGVPQPSVAAAQAASKRERVGVVEMTSMEEPLESPDGVKPSATGGHRKRRKAKG